LNRFKFKRMDYGQKRYYNCPGNVGATVADFLLKKILVNEIVLIDIKP